jgi:uncharacterized protein (TIGR03663 family)
MVFYSRYYIHETLLVLFTFGTLLALGRYLRQPGWRWAALAGVCIGLMHATKETTPLALASMLVALALTRLSDRFRGAHEDFGRLRRRDGLLALVAAGAVSSVLFTSFLGRPEGLLDSLRTYVLYADRAGTASWHFHPWHFYLGLLVHFPAEGTPLWSEGIILVLAVFGLAAGWSRAVPEADARVLRFLGFYTLVLLGVYSGIPYKTPWCLLGFLHGLILLAGAGTVLLVRRAPSVAARVGLATVLAAAVAHLGWQAYSGSFRFPADPRNPYVYAHTGPDALPIARRMEELARAHPDGHGVPVQIISRENLWPLPWYLRRFSSVGWWNGVSAEAPNAPIILITPEMAEPLVNKLYDLPPPGQRELYVSIFDRPMQIRPAVELRGYARASLWDAFRRLEPAPQGE